MGASDPPWDSDFSVGAMAADVASVADHLKFERLFLIGHSLGASVVSCFAGLFPGRLHGLVLVDFGGDPRDDSPEELSALMNGLAEANFEHFAKEALVTCLRGARAEVVTQVVDDLKATPRDSFAGAVLGLLDFDPVISLGDKGIRKLHVYSPFLEAMGLAPIHHRVQGIESRRLEDCSHWAHLDRPEAFAQVLQQFVDHGSLRNPAS